MIFIFSHGFHDFIGLSPPENGRPHYRRVIATPRQVALRGSGGGRYRTIGIALESGSPFEGVAADTHRAVFAPAESRPRGVGSGGTKTVNWRQAGMLDGIDE